MIHREVLPNGVRLVAETIPHVQSVSIGIWVGTGSREEADLEAGISHEIEHMLFKGTPTRSARQIADEFDSIGSHVNAFTDKEMTCYYARVLSEHLPQATEILVDMFLHSLFDPEELEREKSVILEEIKRYEDEPDDLVQETLFASIWPDHPLGKPIIGRPETVVSFQPDDLRHYLQTHYTPERLVIAAAGNFDYPTLADQVRRLFGDVSGRAAAAEFAPPVPAAGDRRIGKDVEQAHFALGVPGFSTHDPDRYALSVLESALGGSMSSRLFQEIREKRGLAYAIGSYSMLYQDTGLLVVAGGCASDRLGQVLDLTLGEFESVRRLSLTPDELERAKNQIKAGMVLSLENMSARMMRLGRNEVTFGRDIPVEEVTAGISAVGPEDIERVAARLFSDRPGSNVTLSVVLPEEALA